MRFNPKPRPVGQCQVCGGDVTVYTRRPEELPLGAHLSKRLPPPRYIVAEPCGHEQPDPVVVRIP